MMDSIKSIWGMLKGIFGISKKAEAMRDAVIETGHGIRSKDDFIPEMTKLVNRFFPDGKVDEYFQQALNHPTVKEIHAMPVEDAKEKGVPLVGKMVTENMSALTEFLKSVK